MDQWCCIYIIPILLSVSLNLYKRFHSFAYSQIVYEYLSVSIHWLWYALHTEVYSRYLQGHFWKECVHWDMTGFRVFTSFLVLSAFPSLNNHPYPFCLCIQFSSILHTTNQKEMVLSLSFWKEPPDLAPSYWDTIFSSLNEFHPVEVHGADCVKGTLWNEVVLLTNGAHTKRARVLGEYYLWTITLLAPLGAIPSTQLEV